MVVTQDFQVVLKKGQSLINLTPAEGQPAFDAVTA
jgi:hypothetical protein